MKLALCEVRSYDAVLCDLVDAIGCEEHGVYIDSVLSDRLRPAGIMIGNSLARSELLNMLHLPDKLALLELRNLFRRVWQMSETNGQMLISLTDAGRRLSSKLTSQAVDLNCPVLSDNMVSTISSLRRVSRLSARRNDMLLHCHIAQDALRKRYTELATMSIGWWLNKYADYPPRGLARPLDIEAILTEARNVASQLSAEITDEESMFSSQGSSEQDEDLLEGEEDGSEESDDDDE